MARASWRSSTSLTSRLLPAEAVLDWGQGPWAFSAGAYRWQTLQDAESPITPPYDRLPSVSLRFAQDHQRWAGLRGWEWSLQTDYTRFRSDPAYTGQVNGSRTLAIARLGHRWESPGGFVAPRLQLHHADYRYDQPVGTALKADDASGALAAANELRREGEFVLRQARALLDASAEDGAALWQAALPLD